MSDPWERLGAELAGDLGPVDFEALDAMAAPGMPGVDFDLVGRITRVTYSALGHWEITLAAVNAEYVYDSTRFDDPGQRLAAYRRVRAWWIAGNRVRMTGAPGFAWQIRNLDDPTDWIALPRHEGSR